MNKKVSSALTLLDQTASVTAEHKHNNDRQFVTALARGLMLLAAFEEQETLSHQQLGAVTKLPKATITRLVHTLVTLGFLRVTAHGHYQLGSSTVRLSAAAWSRYDTVAYAEPMLRQFATQNEVSVNLATEVEGDMRYLACCRSPARLSVNLQVGSAVPMAKTAIGRAFYAKSAPDRRAVIENNLSQKLLATELRQAKTLLTAATDFYDTHGYTLSDGEFSPDILAVAVGVFDVATGQYAYSVNASVPRALWDAKVYATMIVPKLQTLAERIGRGN